MTDKNFIFVCILKGQKANYFLWILEEQERFFVCLLRGQQVRYFSLYSAEKTRAQLRFDF